MLSKTADTKPKPRAVGHPAAGSLSTGIIEAHVTSAKRKIVPLNVSGITSQSGLLTRAVTRITVQTASPMTATTSSTAGNFRFATTFATSATKRIVTTIDTRTQ